MPRIPLLPPQDAPKEVRDIYDDFRWRMQFPSPPNFIMTQGHAVTVARATWDVVRGVLVGGKIPRWTKEMVFVAISKDRGCHYCLAAHIACCRMLGVNPQTLEDLVRDVHSITDPKLRDMILFALQCSRDPRSLTDDDFATMRRHGMGDAELMELIAMSALAVYANIIADATGVEPDAIFAQIAPVPAAV